MCVCVMSSVFDHKTCTSPAAHHHFSRPSPRDGFNKAGASAMQSRMQGKSVPAQAQTKRSQPASKQGKVDTKSQELLRVPSS